LGGDAAQTALLAVLATFVALLCSWLWRQSRSFAEEIAEREQTERALRESEAFLRMAQEASGVGSWEWNILTGQVRWSETMCRIHGVTPRQFDGRIETAVSFFHPEDLARFEAGKNLLLDQGIFTPMEYRIRRRDGSERIVRATGEVFANVSGKPAHCIGTVSDVTERRQLEDQLRHAQKMEAVGQLAGGVAHDFNNLLTVIIGYSESLLTMISSQDPSRSLIEPIHNAASRAASLTQQLLAFSRRAALAPRILSINAVIQKAENMLRRLIGEHIFLTVTLDPEAGHVKLDPSQFDQLIMNLAVNARDAMPRGGTLTIATSTEEFSHECMLSRAEVRPGRYVQLKVSDTGCGMTQEIKHRIFEPFFTTKGLGKGTGLGLAVVHGIVKQSGGYLEVDSEADAGTTFRVYLPAIDDKPCAEPANGATPRIFGAETVLLVEDEQVVRDLAANALRSHGFKVLTAGDGREALCLAEQHQDRIDLLATDVVMPNIGGRELADTMRSLIPEIKVLFLSGYTDDAVLRHGISQDDESFFNKPFTPTSLVRKVREVLDHERKPRHVREMALQR
jgi:PAS domain S-box-containing protein